MTDEGKELFDASVEVMAILHRRGLRGTRAMSVLSVTLVAASLLAEREEGRSRSHRARNAFFVSLASRMADRASFMDANFWPYENALSQEERLKGVTP